METQSQNIRTQSTCILSTNRNPCTLHYPIMPFHFTHEPIIPRRYMSKSKHKCMYKRPVIYNFLNINPFHFSFTSSSTLLPFYFPTIHTLHSSPIWILPYHPSIVDPFPPFFSFHRNCHHDASKRTRFPPLTFFLATNNPNPHFSPRILMPIHPSLSDKFTRSHSLPSLSISFWSATIHLHFYTSVLPFHNHYSSIVIIIRLSLHSRLSYSSPFSLHDLIFLSTTITLFDTWDAWTTERTFLDLRRFNHFFSFPLIQQTIALLLKFISFLLSSISLPRSLPLPSWLASSLHS